MTVSLDWENLGFSYMKLPYRYLAYYRNGAWEKGELTEDATLHLSESSPSLHYGQQAFEGLKAYRTKDGSIQLFRPDQNAKRLQRTADRLLMPQVPVDMFVDACKAVVKANEEYVPPYGTGATLYLRPLLIGVGDIIGVHPADEYIFTIFAMPVGNYFKGGLVPTNFLIQDEYDRAAPHGTGAAKVGGNYAASMLPGKIAHDRNFSDVIYLDPATHTKIEEVGSANFFGITANNEFVTPLRDVYKRQMNDYARKTGLLKEKDKNLEGSDYREGLSAVLSILVPEAHLQFEGQTKDKLGSPLARPVVDSIVSDKLTFFLMENGELASNLIRKAIKARDAREAARKARDESRNGKKSKKDKGLLSLSLIHISSQRLRIIYVMI